MFNWKSLKNPFFRKWKTDELPTVYWHFLTFKYKSETLEIVVEQYKGQNTWGGYLTDGENTLISWENSPILKDAKKIAVRRTEQFLKCRISPTQEQFHTIK